MSEQKELTETLKIVCQSLLSNLHTIVVAKVTGVGGTTITCQPVVNRLVDGISKKLPEFVDVPPIFMQGGGSYSAHPIVPGDYCLLLVSERSFDRWYSGADFQLPPEYRTHDYSDCFALVGVNPLATAITIPSISTQQGDHVTNGNETINGNLTVNGDIVCTGRITCANATIAGIDFLTHVHGGVQTGSGTTGGAE